jgi:peroxiredoxin
MLKKLIVNLLLALVLLSSTSLLAKGPGDKVDDFKLKSTDGKEYKLSDALNNSKYVVVMFWSVQCPFVQAYTGRVNSLANEYTAKGITFWAVNANSTESMDDVKAHAQEKGYPFPVLKDENNVVADMLGATRTPEVFLINHDRTIVYHGRIDDNREESKVTTSDLRNALDEVLSGNEVTVKSTKSFGCSIKRTGE